MQSVLKDLLKEKGGVIYEVGPDISIAEAVREMNDKRIGAVVVMREGKLVGIFTERDVLTKVVGRAMDPTTTPVAEVMTRDVVAVRATTTVDEAMRIVTERRFRHLPVVEEERLIGLVSSGDLTRWRVRDQQSTIEDLVKYISGDIG